MGDCFYEPPFHPWTLSDWREFFAEEDHACLVCRQPVDDERFAVAMEIHHSWAPGSSGYVFGHIECLRTLHPDLG
jgi:hypothetical protein